MKRPSLRLLALRTTAKEHQLEQRNKDNSAHCPSSFCWSFDSITGGWIRTPQPPQTPSEFRSFPQCELHDNFPKRHVHLAISARNPLICLWRLRMHSQQHSTIHPRQVRFDCAQYRHHIVTLKPPCAHQGRQHELESKGVWKNRRSCFDQLQHCQHARATIGFGRHQLCESIGCAVNYLGDALFDGHSITLTSNPAF